MFLPLYLHIIVFTFLNLDAVQLVTTIFKNLLAKQWLEYGCHHSSVDSSAPTICIPGLEFQAHHLRFYHLE